MPIFQKIDSPALIPGILALLLGSITLLGWIFDIPSLTRVTANWNPMVPSTALCFLLSGLSLLKSSKLSDQPISIAQGIIVGLILLLAGARVVELVSGREFGVEFLAGTLIPQTKNIGHMSPPTAIGFLIFGVGMLINQQANSGKARKLTRILAGILFVMGLAAAGYLLKLQYAFETAYTVTGLAWMAFPTAVGMALLGIGLGMLSLRDGQFSETRPEELRATQIYRRSAFVVAATAITTSMVGLYFLEDSVIEGTASNMTQTLDIRIPILVSTLEEHTQRALLAGSEHQLKAAAITWLENAESGAAITRIAEPMLAQGFSGIAVERDNRRSVIAGRLIPDSASGVQLNGEHDVSLRWEGGYYLRVRIPLRSAIHSVHEGFLVIEQSIPILNNLFDIANRWGETGAMVMCARVGQARLLCFPFREESGMREIPDSFNGQPIPITYALANKRGISILTNYLGVKVLSAYSPVGSTSLGLVLRKDLTELYAPAKRELLVAIPLIGILIMTGLWLIRLRVRPVINDLVNANVSEKLARDRFEAAAQSSPDAFVIFESIKSPGGDIVDFRYAYLNRSGETLFKLFTSNLLGRSLLEAFPEQADLFAKYRMVALTGEPLIEEFSLTNNKGAEQWYVRQVIAMATGVAVTIRDVTREKLLVKEIELSNRLRKAIVESAAYSIISTDIDGTILTFNQAAERMLWYRADEMVGKVTPEVFHDPEEIRNRAESLSHELGYTVPPDFEVFVAKAKNNLQEDREWTYVRKDGSRFPVRLSVTALRDESNNLQGFLGIAYDISEQKRAEEYIRHIALHDVLTGLPNRALLDDRVNLAIERQHRNSTPFALAMIDIDRFKHINDSMGHHIGDRLLKEFVRRAKSCLRPTDTLARMGGDEFVMLLPESDEVNARAVLERIKHELAAPINAGLQEVHITLSVGISIFPRDGHDFHELLRCSDVAMYWVKKHGRNGYRFFSQEMDLGAASRLNLERELHLALENDGFSLFYQPKVDLKSNTVIGVEALLRMRNSNGQYILPDNFIPLAEETGLIVPIGQWVLDTACRDAIRMQQLLVVALKVAINISPRQFMSGDLVSTVQDALRQSNLHADQVELEITESVLMDERYNVAASMLALKDLGVTIAIDDFGTGYSSLSYLKRYPISTLKIDQSFVRDATSDSGDATLIVAIIAMGHSLNIPVVAEGIETEEQLSFLATNNCDLGQGFYIGHPMPFDALMQWLADNTRWSQNKALGLH